MRTTLAVLLAVGLLACGDDSGKPKPEAGVDSQPSDTTAADTGAKDTGAKDTAVADTAAPDKGGADMGKATILASTHTGWKKTACSGSGCHTLPPTGHTATKPAECASCHGGNGACAAPGSHSQTSNCVGCHAQKHSFTANVDCKSCHYAAAGTAACP